MDIHPNSDQLEPQLSIWGLSYDDEHFSGPAYKGKTTVSSCTGTGCATWWLALTQAILPSR